MSKKHHYHNYSRPVAPVVNTAVVDEEVTAAPEVEVAIVNEVEPVIVEAEAMSEPIEEENTKSPIGRVVDCDKLRVRKAASVTSLVVCEIPKGSEVMINEACSTGDFYKICTISGVEGFCMKRFIKVNA